MIRVKSRTRTPESGLPSADGRAGNGCGGASPIRSIVTGGSPRSASACGACWSHWSKLRMAATTRPHRGRGLERLRLPLGERACTAALSCAQPSRRSTPSRWCGKLVCRRTQRHRRSGRRRRSCPTVPAPDRRPRADSARCGTRRWHGAYRRRRAASGRSAAAIALQRPAHWPTGWPAPRCLRQSWTAAPARRPTDQGGAALRRASQRLATGRRRRWLAPGEQ